MCFALGKSGVMAFAVLLQKLRLAAESTHGNVIFKRAASQCVRCPRSSFVCHMYKRAGPRSAVGCRVVWSSTCERSPRALDHYS